MKRYEEIVKLTKKYLQGDLSNLKLEYQGKNELKISVVYDDVHHYTYDYDFKIFNHTTANFLGHYSHSVLYKIKLEREEEFEHKMIELITANA